MSVMLQATCLASFAQELPSSMLPADPALTPAGQPPVALPLKAPAPPLKAPAASMNTHPGALNTSGQPSMALPSTAAAAGRALSQVSSVDQPRTEIKSPVNTPDPTTKSLSKLPRRVREAARVEPISTQKAEATAGKAEPLAAKRRQPRSPEAQPSGSRPSVSAATAGILNADSPTDLSKSTSPIKGLVKTDTSQPTGPETFEELPTQVCPLHPKNPSDEAFATGTSAVSSEGFTFFNQTALVAPHGPQYRMNAMKDAIFKGFPKQLAFSHPLPLGSLPLSSSSSLLSETEFASEAHSIQPSAMPAAASMPSLPPFGEATAEVAPTPISKNSGKPSRHPRINALMGARGKGQPLLTPAVTPVKSPASVPTGSSVGAVLGEPMTPRAVLASPSAHAEVDPPEQPTPGTSLGSPMNWSPTPLVADVAPSGTSTQAEAAPFGTPVKALSPPSNANQIPLPMVAEPSPMKSPLKSFTKAFALPKKAPGKTSTKGKGLAGSPPTKGKGLAGSSPAKAASKLMSPIKFIFGSSTAAGKADAASDQLPVASSLALEASVPTTELAHSVDSAAAVVAASSSAQPSTDAPSLLGTSRIPISKPGLSSDEDSKAVLTKLAGSRSIPSSSSALPRAHHRAGVTQPVTTAAEKGLSRNPFAKFGLQTSQTAPEGTSAKHSSLQHSRSVLKRLASRGKENTGAASSSHVEVASASAHPQPLTTSNKLGGVTGAHSSLMTSRPVSKQVTDSGHQKLNAPGFQAQPVSVFSSNRGSPVQPQLFASDSAVAVAAVNSISHGSAAVKVRQNISHGNSGMGSTSSSSPKMGSAFNTALSHASPLAAIDSMPHQDFGFSFSSAPRLSPVNLAPPQAASLTPLGVAATPATVFASAQPAGPDEAMPYAPQKPQAISTPVFEGTRLFKLGKLDRGKARMIKKAGQDRTKVPPAPVHQSVRQMFPQTPSAEGGFNSLPMGGRQLAFEEPAFAAPGMILHLVIPISNSCRQLACPMCMHGPQHYALTIWMSLLL